MVARRAFILLMVVAALLVILALRLLWLQTTAVVGQSIGNNDLLRKSVEQRRASVILDDGRGRIVDKYGMPLAGQEGEALLVLPQWPRRNGTDRSSNAAAAILGIDEEEWSTYLQSLVTPSLWYEGNQREPLMLTDEQALKLRQLQSPELLVVPYVRRYLAKPIASHLIGYTGENPDRLKTMYPEKLEQGTITQTNHIGASGLERAFDRFLQGWEHFKYVYYVNGRYEPLVGLKHRWMYPHNPFYPLQLVTTIDGELQKETERLMEQQHIRDGAIVVLDAANSDVLVMASRPDFNPYSVDPEKGMWRNRALSAHIPGSIFKTVIAAAALEDGVVQPGETFHCPGEWSRYHLRCWKREGHGTLSLEQAYAQSCNVTFARIAAKLDPNRLEEISHMLGLAAKIGWSGESLVSPMGEISPFNQFDGEQTGQIFDPKTSRSDFGVLAQTGIGQRDVRLTPLQAANMVVAVLNGGKLYAPRVVTKIKHNNQRTMINFPEQIINGHYRSSGKGISRSTARWLKDAMKLTVTEGTGKLLSGVPGGAAGKTGTAETGSPGLARVNQWFIGYAPANQPKYAFAVLVNNRSPRDDHQALHVAGQLIRLLAR